MTLAITLSTYLMITSVCLSARAANLQEIHALLYPHKDCAFKLNVTYPNLESDPSLLYDIAWILIDFEDIVDCIDDKRTQFRESKMPEQWYASYMFDKKYALMQENKIQEITQIISLSCLDDADENMGFYTCLQATKENIRYAFDNKYALGTTEYGTILGICKLVQDPSSCVKSVSSACSDHVATMLTALLETVSGHRCAIIAKEEKEKAEAPPIDPRLQESFLYRCGTATGVDISLFLPPDSNTVSRISNMTAASIQYDNFLEQLCSKIPEFTKCVKSNSSHPEVQANEFLKAALDIDHLDQTLNIFCGNTKVLKQHFRCHVELTNTTASDCWGGLGKLLSNFEQLSDLGLPVSVSTEQTCSDVLAAFQCRAKKLTVCDTEYSEILQKVYLSFASKSCQESEPKRSIFPFFIFKTPALDQCFEESFTKVLTSVEPWNMTKAIVERIGTLCNYRSPFKPCLQNRRDSISTNTKEALLFFSLNLDGVEQAMDMICRLRDDFKAGVSCLSLYGDSTQAWQCWNTMEIDLHDLDHYGDQSIMETGFKDTAHRLCSALSKAWNCFVDIVKETCSGTASSLMKEITHLSLISSCHATDDGDDGFYEDDEFELDPFPLFRYCTLEIFGRNGSHSLGNNQPSEGFSKNDLSHFVVMVIEITCSRPVELTKFLRCLEEYRDMEDDQRDNIVLRLVDTSKLAQASNKFCSLFQASVPSVDCLIQSVGAAGSNDACSAISLSEPNDVIMSGRGFEEKASALCQYLHGLYDCLKTQLKICDLTLVSMFQTIIPEIIPCSINPTNQSSAITTEPGSSASTSESSVEASPEPTDEAAAKESSGGRGNFILKTYIKLLSLTFLVGFIFV